VLTHTFLGPLLGLLLQEVITRQVPLHSGSCSCWHQPLLTPLLLHQLLQMLLPLELLPLLPLLLLLHQLGLL
jgi:hypothetical protein